MFPRSPRKYSALFVLFVSASFSATGRRSCKRPSTCCIRMSRNPLSSFSLSLFWLNVLDNAPSKVSRREHLTYLPNIDDPHGASFAFIDMRTLNRDSRTANESRVRISTKISSEGAKTRMKNNNRMKIYITYVMQFSEK